MVLLTRPADATMLSSNKIIRKIFECWRVSLNRHFIPRRNPLRSSAKTSASFAVNDFVLGLLILFVATAFVTQSPTPAAAQTPTPAPSEKRDLGLQSNAPSNSQTDQTKSKEAKQELVLQTGYSNFFGATRLVFSPDHRLLATSTFRTNTIKLWETATGRELRDLSTGGQNTNSLAPVIAFSRDGRFLAAAAGNNSVKVWDVTTGGELQPLSGPQAPFMAAIGVSFIGFSADGKKLVTMSDALRIWDVPR